MVRKSDSCRRYPSRRPANRAASRRVRDGHFRCRGSDKFKPGLDQAGPGLQNPGAGHLPPFSNSYEGINPLTPEEIPVIFRVIQAYESAATQYSDWNVLCGTRALD